MVYQPGHYVYPSDLPRRVLCRVEQAETLSTSGGPVQVLRLEPLEGPWPLGTALIRLDEYVVPVSSSQLAQRSPSVWLKVDGETRTASPSQKDAA